MRCCRALLGAHWMRFQLLPTGPTRLWHEGLAVQLCDLAPGIRTPGGSHELAALACAPCQSCSTRPGLTYASVECSRVRLYQSTQAMTSSLAWPRVTKRCPCSRSTFNEPNRVSLQALSQPLPLRLIEAVMPHWASTSLKSSLAYWLPRSLWKISPAC